MWNRFFGLALCAAVAAGVAGCATSRSTRTASGSASDAGDPPRATPPPPPTATPAPAPAVGAREGPCPPPSSAPIPPACPPFNDCECRPTCGLPCENGCSDWHFRALVGLSSWSGTDPGDDCCYYGADIGHTRCNCWGVDAFWRHHTAHFDRDPSGADGGTWNHLGVKATYEHSLGGGRLYGWAGAGPEYWWTSDYLHDDSGFGVFGEAGLGYILDSHIKVRAGVNLHGLSTDTGRRDPGDDGSARWLWLVAPVVEIEFS